MTIYDAYATWYDSSGHVRFALLIEQYVHEVLALHRVAGRRLLDLACGTGTLACMLAENGWDVVGLDASAAMLAVARTKAINLDLAGRATFVAGDMRAFGATDGVRAGSFDVVSAVYDSLNYMLTDHDLGACFRGVAQALRPGGLFVADMNTRHFLAYDWGEHDVVEAPGFVQVARSTFDSTSDCSTMWLTCFAGDDTHGYTRFDETHVERAYAMETVRHLLEAAGLVLEAVYDCFTFQTPEPRTQRVCLVARLPAHGHESR